MATMPAPIAGDLDRRNCERKQPYTTELNARINAQAVINDTRPGRHGRTPRRMWVYHCSHCLGWHMTSQGGLQRLPAVTSTELYAGSGR